MVTWSHSSLKWSTNRHDIVLFLLEISTLKKTKQFDEIWVLMETMYMRENSVSLIDIVLILSWWLHWIEKVTLWIILECFWNVLEGNKMKIHIQFDVLREGVLY